jgi:hypothetical protein
VTRAHSLGSVMFWITVLSLNFVVLRFSFIHTWFPITTILYVLPSTSFTVLLLDWAKLSGTMPVAVNKKMISVSRLNHVVFISSIVINSVNLFPSECFKYSDSLTNHDVFTVWPNLTGSKIKKKLNVGYVIRKIRCVNLI